MKKINLFALCAIITGSLMLVSCGGNVSTPKASLKNDVDSISYAFGVTLAEQGLTQFLEQSGIIESSANFQYEYQMKISQTEDAAEKESLEKELKAKIDALNKKNAPKLNEFLKGLQEAIKGGEDKTAYIQGLTIGNQISEQILPGESSLIFAGDTTKKMKNDLLISGLFGVLRNQKLAIPTSEAVEFIQTEKDGAQADAKRIAEEEGKTFLAENAKREEVVVLPSGLQYEVIKEGTGEIPTATDQVEVHYHGTLVDGTVFDSSIDRGEPAVFGVNQVIPGWTEALQLMPVGSEWKVYIPYDLGYGEQGAGGDIKPYSTLIFDVKLLSIGQ